MTGRNITLTRPGSHPGKKDLCDPYRQRREQDGRLVIYVYRTSKYSAPGPRKGPFMTTCYVPRQISPILPFFFFFTSIHSHFEIFAVFPIIFPFLPIIITVHHDTIFFFCFFFASRFDKKKLCHLLYHNYSTTFENRRALNNSRDVIDNIVSRGSPKISSTCCVFPRFFREFTRYRI